MKKILSVILLLVLTFSLFSCLPVKNNNSSVADNDNNDNFSLPVPLMSFSDSWGLILPVFENEKLYTLDDLEFEFEYGFSENFIHIETFESYEIVISNDTYTNDTYTYSILFDEGPYNTEDFLRIKTTEGYQYPKNENISLPKELFSDDFGVVICQIFYTSSDGSKEKNAQSSFGYKTDGERIEFSYDGFAFNSDLWLSSMYSSDEEKTELIEELTEKYDLKYVDLPFIHFAPQSYIVLASSSEARGDAYMAVSSNGLVNRKTIAFYTAQYYVDEELKSSYLNGFSFKYKGDYTIEYHKNDPTCIYIYLWDDGIVLKTSPLDSFKKEAKISDVSKIKDIEENQEIRNEKLAEKIYDSDYSDDGWTFSAKKPGRITATAPDGQEIVVYNLIPEFLKEIGKIIFDFFAFVFG